MDAKKFVWVRCDQLCKLYYPLQFLVKILPDNRHKHIAKTSTVISRAEIVILPHEATKRVGDCWFRLMSYDEAFVRSRTYELKTAVVNLDMKEVELRAAAYYSSLATKPSDFLATDTPGRRMIDILSGLRVRSGEVPFGGKFKRAGSNDLYIRVRPTSYLLNSTLVSDSLSRGRVMVVRLATHTCFFIEGDEQVKLVKE